MIQVEQLGAVKVIRMARAMLGRPLYWTAAYWIEGLLIDAGPRCTARELSRVLASHEIEQIVVTHGHEDHIGGLAALRERYPEAPIYASRRTLPLIAEPARLDMHRYRRLVWGMPRPVKDAIALDAVGDRLTAGDYTFRVIETPGHCSDHISLFEPNQRWLFTGDAFIGGRDLAWSPEIDMFSTIGSLRTLASLRPERIFPGSGNVRRNPQPDLQAKIGYLVALSQEVGRLEAKGLDVPAIVDRLIPQTPSIQRWTLGHFSSRALVEACRAYNAVVFPEGAPPEDSSTARRPWPISDSPPKPTSGRSDRVR